MINCTNFCSFTLNVTNCISIYWLKKTSAKTTREKNLMFVSIKWLFYFMFLRVFFDPAAPFQKKKNTKKNFGGWNKFPKLQKFGDRWENDAMKLIKNHEKLSTTGILLIKMSKASEQCSSLAHHEPYFCWPKCFIIYYITLHFCTICYIQYYIYSFLQ